MRSLYSTLLLMALGLVAREIRAAAAAKSEDGDARPAVIEGTVSVGARHAFVEGDEAAFQQRARNNAGRAAGLEELFVSREDDASTFRLEARAMGGEGDYRMDGEWKFDDKLSLDFGYNRIRTFYDGSGAYFGPTDSFVTLYDERLAVDRERLWLQLGFKPEDLPALRLRYERLTRRGKKPSAARGEFALTNGRGPRSIVPTFTELDEARDIMTLEANGGTDAEPWAVGVRYERGELDNARQIRRNPDEATARAHTTNEGTRTDLFRAHAFTQRRFGEKLLASAGAMTATLDTQVDGDRITGLDYDPIFDPAGRRAAFDQGLLNLSGGARLKQWVGNLNAAYQLSKHWSAHPSVRYEHLHTDSMASYVATNVAFNLVTTQQSLAAQSQTHENKLSERLELRYTGRPSWTYSWRGDWTQTRGDLVELQRDTATALANLDRASDYERLAQKYTFTTNWYARPGLTFAGEYYYRLRMNDSTPTRDSLPAESPDRYPAYITSQDFATHDFNVRASWRPFSTLSLVTRYDVQRSKVTTTAERLPEVRTGTSLAHIVSQSLTWSPLPPLYLTAAVNLTYDQTKVPADFLVWKGDSNYLNTLLTAGYAVTKRSDLLLDMAQFRARNFLDYSALSLPDGAKQENTSASISWIFRASEHLSYFTRLTHVRHRDDTSGGRNNYEGAVIYAKVQYTF